VGSLDTNRGAKRAREARQAAGLDPVAPLACLLTAVEERFGIPVVIAALPDGVAGACAGQGAAPMLFVNGRHATPRQRFTLAHELGHLRCRHDGAVHVETIVTLDGKVTNPYEIQANAFAGELLVPKAAVADRFDREPGLEEVVLIAAEYGISALAALFRLVTAGAIGQRRAGRVREEIDAQLHLDVYERLAPPVLEDRLQAIEELPYISPALAGSALAAALTGAASPAAAARASGVAPQRLAIAVEAISGR
jgi:Zn-dependent peptidase ImmA (M78 family)